MEYMFGGLIAALCILLGFALRRPIKIESEHSSGLLCAYIDTQNGAEGDPFDYTLEPCDNEASLIIGCRSLCEDHFAIYILEMSGKLEN